MKFEQGTIKTCGNMLLSLYEAVTSLGEIDFPVSVSVQAQELRETTRTHLQVYQRKWNSLIRRYSPDGSPVRDTHPQYDEWLRLSNALRTDEISYVSWTFDMEDLLSYRLPNGDEPIIRAVMLDILKESGVVVMTDLVKRVEEEGGEEA